MTLAACWASVLLGLGIGGAALAGTATLAPVYWDTGNQRWADAAFNPFADAQRTTYDYANGSVTIVYEPSAHTFTGTLTARGLKPNFAYQIKINGKPVYYWAAQGDDLANEQLGYAGRWWVSRIVHATGANIGGWNSSDAEYEQWKALGFTDGAYDYVFEGYLLFDYFVTDAEGNATLTFALDSSFHVLWKVSQRTPNPNDSAPTAHSVVASSASPWYGADYPTTDVQIYAEWQSDRPVPGTVALASGLYNVRIFLTEESFHQGPWATVMAHDAVTFLVRPENRPPAAVDDAASTPYRMPLAVNALGNDTDPDGDPLAITAVSRPQHGKAAIVAGTTVTYTPGASFSGKDSFTYTASDGHGGTAKAKVRVTVGRPIDCTIAGRITDQATGAPIRGMTVKLWKQDGTRWTAVAEKTTGREGAYSFGRWMFGIYLVGPRSARWVTTPTSQPFIIDGVGQSEACDFTATPK